MSDTGVNLVRLDAAEWQVIHIFAQGVVDSPLSDEEQMMIDAGFTPVRRAVCKRILDSLEKAVRDQP